MTKLIIQFILIMRTFKLSFNNTIKKMKLAPNMTYEEFTKKVVNNFDVIQSSLKFTYLDQTDTIVFQNQQGFQMMLESDIPSKTITVKGEINEFIDLNQSQISNSKNNNSLLDNLAEKEDPIFNIVNEMGKKGSNAKREEAEGKEVGADNQKIGTNYLIETALNSTKMPVQIKKSNAKEENKNIQKKSQQKSSANDSIKQSLELSDVQQMSIKSKQNKQQCSFQAETQNQKQLRRKIQHQFPLQSKTIQKCIICKSKSYSKWKCLSCQDYIICNDCYTNSDKIKDHKNSIKHQFVQIKDDNFWQIVNYRSAIVSLFNPKGKEENRKGKVQAWISEQDILLNRVQFVRAVWSEAQWTVDKFVGDFQDWEREQVKGKQ